VTVGAFQYKALDSDGRFVTGELQADSSAAVVSHLAELGYTPLETQERAGTAGRGWRRFLTSPRLPPREVTVLIRDLALLIKAGLPLDEALKLLAGDARPAAARLVNDLRQAIGSGASFAEALAGHAQSFPPDVVAMVRVAEASGGLEHVLEALAEDRGRRERVAEKVGAALRYPIFLFLVAIGVLSFFLVFVVPQFAVVLKDFGTEPDPLVATVLGLSEWLNANGDMVLGVLAGLLLLGFVLLRMHSTRGPIIRAVRRLPGLRGIVVMRRTATLCRGLGTLLGNGVTLTDALKVMTDTAGADADALGAVHERVRRGGRLVDALSASNLVPPLAARMLRVGEESGELATVARRSADFYEAKLAERLDRLAGIVGPAAIVVISVVVGGLIVSIMSTLLSVNQVVL
jgi:general secretion pathway protein F